MSNSKIRNSPAQAAPETDANIASATVDFPAQFSMLDDLREFVGQQAQVCGLDNKAVYAVQLAVDEAFTNIIEHAFDGESQDNIRCICQCMPDGLEITLIDCGKPFNPNDVPEPDLVSDIEDRQIGGLGMYFMRQMMDEVCFSFAAETSDHPGCNMLRMVKRKKKNGSGGSRRKGKEKTG